MTKGQEVGGSSAGEEALLGWVDDLKSAVPVQKKGEKDFLHNFIKSGQMGIRAVRLGIRGVGTVKFGD